MKAMYIVIASFFSALALSCCSVAAQTTESVLYTFKGLGDGGNPISTLVADSSGALYGTTYGGGTQGWGVVFKMTPADGGEWKQTVIHEFSLSDGVQPLTLARDSAGNLFGITYGGGSTSCYTGCGTVFELSPTAQSWQFRVIHAFTGAYDGYWPIGLTVAPNGTVYVTTQQGGNGKSDCASGGCGTVYQLQKVSNIWHGRTIHAFTFIDGIYPYGNPVVDSSGNIYGTTYDGGSALCSGNGCGNVFRLSLASDGSWHRDTLYTFTGGDDGLSPLGGLTLDAAGNLYGTTGGGSLGGGVAFELTASQSLPWKQTVLHSFGGGSDGAGPGASMIFDAAGNLYGTTGGGGLCTQCGTVFQLVRGAATWNENILYSFPFPEGSNGFNPILNGVTLDQSGNIYGSTVQGGPYERVSCPYGSCGVVYEISIH